MDRPNFKPEVPGPLLEGASSRDKWMYEQLSIQHQQNNWIIDQLSEGQKRFDDADNTREIMKREILTISSRITKLERIKDLLSAKWAVIAALVSPILLAVVAALIAHWVDKKLK